MGDLSWRFDHREYGYIKEVLDSGFASSTSGSMNTRLERAFAERFGRKFAVTFNSGTTTLHASLFASGVRFGDEVITTPLTVISCMNAILYCNAVPVFADVDPDTFLIDPNSIERCITPRTKAIMPVHLYGQVCDMDRIMAIAKKHNLAVVEDCAQCYLGTYKGRIGGTIGDVASYSFENSKHLTCGDGGIIICDDEELADRIRKLCCQGFRNATATSGKIRVSRDVFQNPAYKRHSVFGFMYRLPEVAAAMALGQLEKIDEFVAKRRRMAELYTEAIGNVEWLRPQKTPAGDVNSHFCFAMRLTHESVTWEQFRQKHIEFGGDGIYAAWTLCYLEDSLDDIRSIFGPMGLGDRLSYTRGLCPTAERIQGQLMQLTTNQKDESEMQQQAETLARVVRHFS